MKIDPVRLSKTLSHALRHAPKLYDIALDSQGWIQIEELLTALTLHSPQFQGVTRSDIESVMKSAKKQRFEVRGDRIRARYGHSLADKIDFVKADPPAQLFHGTAPQFLESIRKQGLIAKGRQYVHLSTDRETALLVASRRTDQPVLFRIDTPRAHREGIGFYPSEDGTWLSDPLAWKYLIEDSE